MRKFHLIFPVLTLIMNMGVASCSASPTTTPTAAAKLPATQTPIPTLSPPEIPTVLISEVLTGIEGNNNHEFIELYNTAEEKPIDLLGWSLWYKLSGTDPEKLVVRWTHHALVPPQGHYLLVRQGENAGIIADYSFDVSMIPQRGSLQLRMVNGAVADSLSWGSGAASFAEGSPANVMKNDLTLERAPGGSKGNWIDTQDNAKDFSFSSPNPQNAGSASTPQQAGTLKIAMSAPEAVPPGEWFTYTLTATNNTSQAVQGVTVQLPLPQSLNLAPPTAEIEIASEARYWGLDPIGTDSQVILWQAGTLQAGDEAVTSIEVQAPWTYAEITAANYSIQAEDWPYPAFGAPIRVAVRGGAIPIDVLQDLVGENVVIEGTATMYTGGYYAGGGNVKFYIEDETAGVQVWVPGGEGEVDIRIGDQVRVAGNLTVYRGALELVVNDSTEVEILAKATPGSKLSPSSLAIGEAAQDSSFAGKLVQIEGIVARNEEFSYSYELDLIDEAGDLLTLYVDKQTSINVELVEIGQHYRITGILEIYDTRQQLYPRVQEDLERIYPPILTLEMDAPILAEKGEEITITLTAVNYTPNPLTGLVITATLPKRGGFQLTTTSASSEIQGSVVRWRIPELAGEGGRVSVQYQGTVATADEYLVFEDYTATANEWTDPMGGEPYLIFLGDSVPIWAIQGSGDRSPYLFKQVKTAGIVTGVFPELQGLWIQEVKTDSDPATSSGLFIHTGELEILAAAGNIVRVSGVVRETYQQTQLVIASANNLERIDLGGSLPAAVALDPPSLEKDAVEYFERLEGMLVAVSDPGIAVAPTSKYGEYVLVLAKHGIDRLWQEDITNNGLAIMVDDGSAAIHHDRSGLAYVVNSGDQITGLIGPLAYTYGRYKIEPIVQPQLVARDVPLPTLALVDENSFSIMSWNAENFFDVLDPHPSDPEKPSISEYQISIAKAANTILSAGAPTIVGLQEIENIDILEDIAGHAALAGFGYQPFLIEGMDSRYIDNGYLVRTEIARVLEVEQHTAPEGLTSRPPLRILVEIQTTSGLLQVHILNNHFTAMSGGESATEPRRTAQAAWNTTIASELLAENPKALIVILGDLNSFYDSAPLDTLRKAGFRHVFEFDPQAGWYSYIYEGASQNLDHILVVPDMFNLLQEVVVLHVNADYALPERKDESPMRKSDHDPVIAIFSLPE
jgi:hypothetical protein